MSALNGTKHHNSKLTADQVRSMREEYIPYVNGYKKLGEKYGVDFSTVRDCVQYYSYKNVYQGARDEGLQSKSGKGVRQVWGENSAQ